MSSQTFHIRHVVDEVVDHYQKIIAGVEDECGHPTGLQNLDRLIGGLRPGSMFLLVGRPSMGKTSLMLTIAEHVCLDQKIPTLIFSGELSAFELVRRILFSRAGKVVRRLPSQYMLGPTDAELLRLQTVAREIAGSSLFIADSFGHSLEALREIVIRYKLEKNVGLIAIDRFQLIRSDSPQVLLSPKREAAEVSEAIKTLAEDLRIPVLVIAELSRKLKSHRRDSHIPRLSHLQHYREIERYADIIGLLNQPSCYGKDHENWPTLKKEFELTICKNQDRKIGGISGLLFKEDLMRFENIETNPY